MTERVWFASSGSYSDYSVVAVFASRAAAAAYVALKDDDWRVEPEDDEGYPVYSSVPEPEPSIRIWASVEREGVTRTYEMLESFVPMIDGTVNPTPVCDVQSTIYPSDRSPHIDIFVKGRDIERSRKVFTERVAQTVADFDVLLASVTASRQGS